MEALSGAPVKEDGGPMPSAMKLEQRLDTVLHGGIPDRVPCIPLLYYFAAHYTGTPYRDFLTDMATYRAAMDACFWEVGPWDAMYPLPTTMDAPDFDITWGAGVGMKPALAAGGDGDELVMQLPETETLMEAGDYACIIANRFPGKIQPLLRFMGELVARLSEVEADTGFWAGRFVPHLFRLAARWVFELERWRVRGVPFFITFSLEAPFDTFSMARGLMEFSMDLHRRGEEIREASLRLSRGVALAARLSCAATRTRRFLLLVHRSSNDFISSVQFERYAYPALKHIAGYLDSHGILFGMHCDGNWDLNLELMTDLPADTYFQFDGSTDIFRARRVLGGRYTIMGDVPPDMLTIGSQSEVEEYCRRLIREVGREGRFILSSGCEVPSNARPENVRAMIGTAKSHGRY